MIFNKNAIRNLALIEVWDFATVSFDGFQRASCLLQEAKGNYDRFFISDTQIIKWWSGSTGMVAQAIVQNAVVVATPRVRA